MRFVILALAEAGLYPRRLPELCAGNHRLNYYTMHQLEFRMRWNRNLSLSYLDEKCHKDNLEERAQMVFLHRKKVDEIAARLRKNQNQSVWIHRCLFPASGFSRHKLQDDSEARSRLEQEKRDARAFYHSETVSRQEFIDFHLRLKEAKDNVLLSSFRLYEQALEITSSRNRTKDILRESVHGPVLRQIDKEYSAKFVRSRPRRNSIG